MEITSNTFPSLKKLYISVEATAYIANPLIVEVEEYRYRLLAPADSMVRSYSLRLRDCQIASNASFYEALARIAKDNGSRKEKGGIGASS